MSEEVRRYFTHLGERADPESVAGMRKSCVFEIDDVGTWHVTVDNGEVVVREGDGDANAHVSTSSEVFERILRHELKPTSAYLTGRLRIRGELATVMRLQPLLEAHA